jgi:hypothetical protein
MNHLNMPRYARLPVGTSTTLFVCAAALAASCGGSEESSTDGAGSGGDTPTSAGGGAPTSSTSAVTSATTTASNTAASASATTSAGQVSTSSGEATGNGGGGGGGAGHGPGGGGAGAGGPGGGGAGTVCAPGVGRACYAGEPRTLGVGLCSAGTEICLDDGSGYGPCEGEVLPVVETCLTRGDDDCDGDTNEEGQGCECTPRTTQSCYSAEPATEGVGLCASGLQTCRDDGLGWDACEGEVVPTDETCATQGDDDCDGATNEEGAGCICSPNDTEPCYDGPGGTQGVGLCAAGSRQCDPQGTGWGQCLGEIVPAPEDCETPEDEDCNGSTPACPFGYLWTYRFGDAAAQTAYGVATDATGNVFITGSMGGTTNFGGTSLTSAGGDDIYLVKFDPLGNHIWSQRFGDGTTTQVAEAVATDSAGNVVMTGVLRGTANFGGGTLTANGSGDVFVAKFDPAGNHLWSRRFGDGMHQGGDHIACDSIGDVFITGASNGTINFGGSDLVSAGDTDVFITKFDSAGNHLWSKRFGNSVTQRGVGVAVDAQGDVALTGTSSGGTINFGGSNLSGTDNVFLVKFDGLGNHLWSKMFGDGLTQYGARPAVDSNDNVVITGGMNGTANFGGGALSSSGSEDVYVAKFDPSGNHLWSKLFGDASYQRAHGVAIDLADDIILTGGFAGNLDFGGGPLLPGYLYLAKLDDAGTFLGARSFGNAYSRAVATDANGNILLTGELTGSVDLGGGTLTSAGSFDIFLAKFAP